MQALAGECSFMDEEEAEIFRIEQGIPRWGRELTGEIIPVEANLERAASIMKRAVTSDRKPFLG